MQSPVI